MSVKLCSGVDLRFSSGILSRVVAALKSEHEMVMLRRVGWKKMMAVLPRMNFLLSAAWPWSMTGQFSIMTGRVVASEGLHTCL